MPLHGYAIFDDLGELVKGQFPSEQDAERWLIDNPLYDLYDEDGEYVAQSLQFERGALVFRVPDGGTFQIRSRARSEFTIGRLHQQPAAAQERAERRHDASLPRVNGTLGSEGRESPPLEDYESEMTGPGNWVGELPTCTRCGEPYLPEVAAEHAAAAAHRRGRCQDCTPQRTTQRKDLTHLVDRVLRGLPPE